VRCSGALGASNYTATETGKRRSARESVRKRRLRGFARSCNPLQPITRRAGFEAGIGAPFCLQRKHRVVIFLTFPLAGRIFSRARTVRKAEFLFSQRAAREGGPSLRNILKRARFQNPGGARTKWRNRLHDANAKPRVARLAAWRKPSVTAPDLPQRDKISISSIELLGGR